MPFATEVGGNPRTSVGVSRIKQLGYGQGKPIVPGLVQPCLKLTDIFGKNNDIVDRIILLISCNPEERDETMKRCRARELATDGKIARENQIKIDAFMRENPGADAASIFQMYAATKSFGADGNVMPGL